ncbi:guanitoxin biosynthesis heme-dependent pre-guanitoxin N-hydroxylase GntA [Oleiagrimonas sp. C23AA]|uniref:guanitoxin biosynthesis heme-dependent pre-guanitoxin N-hydroxylase GntA n=1 Tax=Oleiagrimonas sp. C23AA TaxID=2719047 RepID=UPI001F0ECBAE|nr:guanitoxin biosynthesis heme-dependent pre-guanitoxin N-hydroxylase GntA [Oleiagrimonas sp. C23AA]
MDPAAALDRLIGTDTFPCVGAKSARSRHAVHHVLARSMRSAEDDADITRSLQQFAATHGDDMFVSMAVIFEQDDLTDETEFEQTLWARLQGIHDIDTRQHDWDARVSRDPASPDFSMSVGGHAFYVVGLHPAASRPARRFAHPTLIFNLHQQFEKLRADGRYQKMRHAIQARDLVYSGSTNPMLSDHGTRSEAAQYSGRRVEASWPCPFHAHAPACADPQGPPDDDS